MGLFMSAAEPEEMARRDALGDQMPSVVELIAGVDTNQLPEGEVPDFGSNFAGIW